MIIAQISACAVATDVVVQEAPEQTIDILYLQEEKTEKTGSYSVQKDYLLSRCSNDESYYGSTDSSGTTTSSPQTDAKPYSLLWIYMGYMISIIGILALVAVIVGVCRATQVRRKK